MAAICEVEQAINLLFRLLEVKDSELTKESIELLNTFHEVYMEKVKQTTKDADMLLLGVPERSDFVRDIRLGLAGSFGPLITIHDQLRRLEKLSPSESALNRILQANSENHMLDVCAKGNGVIEKMEWDFDSVKSNLQIVRSVCSLEPKDEIVAGDHEPFLSCVSFAPLKTLVEMFREQVWNRIFELSPQNLSAEDPPTANNNCVKYNGRCKEALGLLPRIRQSTLSFYDLTAENEGFASACRILKELKSGKMSWDEFYSLHYPPNDADHDAPANPDRHVFPQLLERRCEMQKRLIEKCTEQMVADTLLATIDAVSLASNAYEETYPTLLIYFNVLMGELALWEKLTSKCHDLIARRKAEDGIIKEHIVKDRVERDLKNESAERLSIQREHQTLDSSVAEEVRSLNAVGLNLDISHIKTNVLENIMALSRDFGLKEPVQKHLKLMQKMEEFLYDSREIVQYVHDNIAGSNTRRGRSSRKSVGQDSVTGLNDSLNVSSPVWNSP